MEEQVSEQTLNDTQTAEAEKDEKGEQKKEVSLGKFKDVNSLLSAYNSLQAEFTKRCQRIKELESEKPVDKVEQSTPPETNAQKETISTTQEDKEQVLKDYLKELLGAKQKAIILDKAGLGIKTPTAKPKTFAEAGLLAKDLLNQTKK